MHTHEDLIGNRGTNPGEIPGNGRDDDGNGYVVSAGCSQFVLPAVHCMPPLHRDTVPGSLQVCQCIDLARRACLPRHCFAQDDVYGWDFVSNDNSVFDGVGDDHGT